VSGRCEPLPAEPQPEVVDVGAEPGTPDPAPRDPGPTDPGAPSPDVPARADGADAATASDGGCPDGTSLVSGICLKDPPKRTPREDGGGGGCQAGGEGPLVPAGLTLAGLLVLLAARRATERG
jgi:MYXO-CTERM domain-containing protein